MGLSLSKKQNPLVEEDFDGESGDYPLDPKDYKTELGPEWIFGENEIEEIKKQVKLFDPKEDYSKIKMFSLQDHIFAAKCVKVYDGDTVNLVMDFNGELIRYRFRLIGFNSPEIRASCKEEREKAIEARDYLANRLLGKTVVAVLGPFDKYGRPLCDLYLIEDEENINLDTIFNIHINKEMLDKGYGVPYNP